VHLLPSPSLFDYLLKPHNRLKLQKIQAAMDSSTKGTVDDCGTPHSNSVVTMALTAHNSFIPSPVWVPVKIRKGKCYCCVVCPSLPPQEKRNQAKHEMTLSHQDNALRAELQCRIPNSAPNDDFCVVARTAPFLSFTILHICTLCQAFIRQLHHPLHLL
jgi:hypothetical protein